VEIMAKKLSPTGAALIKTFEGCHKRDGDRFKPYVCPGGVLTIGWGHTNHHGRQFDRSARWTQQDCDGAFDEDMVDFGRQVAAVVTVPLKQHQFDALVSFAYNVGIGNLRASTLLRKLNAGDSDGAALEFHRWNRSNGKVLPGLVRRRAAEALLFQGIADLDFDGNPDPMPQSVGVR
jgi:lysozyme